MWSCADCADGTGGADSTSDSVHFDITHICYIRKLTGPISSFLAMARLYWMDTHEVNRTRNQT